MWEFWDGIYMMLLNKGFTKEARIIYIIID